MSRKEVRQGDVLLVSTHKVPSSGAKVIEDQGHVVLAYGEASGHVHRVAVMDPMEAVIQGMGMDPVPAVQLFEEPDGSRLLVVKKPARLLHTKGFSDAPTGDHGPLDLFPSTWEVIPQMSYEWKVPQRVLD